MTTSSQTARDALANRKLRTALVLASVALAFFIGIILRGWMLSQ